MVFFYRYFQWTKSIRKKLVNTKNRTQNEVRRLCFHFCSQNQLLWLADWSKYTKECSEIREITGERLAKSQMVVNQKWPSEMYRWNRREFTKAFTCLVIDSAELCRIIQDLHCELGTAAQEWPCSDRCPGRCLLQKLSVWHETRSEFTVMNKRAKRTDKTKGCVDCIGTRHWLASHMLPSSVFVQCETVTLFHSLSLPMHSVDEWGCVRLVMIISATNCLLCVNTIKHRRREEREQSEVGLWCFLHRFGYRSRLLEKELGEKKNESWIVEKQASRMQ